MSKIRSRDKRAEFFITVLHFAGKAEISVKTELKNVYKGCRRVLFAAVAGERADITRETPAAAAAGERADITRETPAAAAAGERADITRETPAAAAAPPQTVRGFTASFARACRLVFFALAKNDGCAKNGEHGFRIHSQNAGGVDGAAVNVNDCIDFLFVCFDTAGGRRKEERLPPRKSGEAAAILTL